MQEINKKSYAVSLILLALLIVYTLVISLRPQATQDKTVKISTPQELSLVNTVLNALEGPPEITLTATVKPDTAKNKAVDWQALWLDTNNTDEVSEYISLTPLTDGSNVVKVVCLKPFSGQIRLIAKSRANGISAECLAVFSGIPSSMAVITDITPKTDPDYGEWIPIMSNSTTVMDITLDNYFHSVGEKFGDFDLMLSAWGVMTLAEKTLNPVMPQAGWIATGKTRSVDLNEIIDEFCSAEITGGKLHIVTKKAIESYSYTETVSGSGVGLPDQSYLYEFAGWDNTNGNKTGYFKIFIQENVSGISTELIFRIESDIEEITLGTSVVEF